MVRALRLNAQRQIEKDLGCLRCESARSASGVAWTLAAPPEGAQKSECASFSLASARRGDFVKVRADDGENWQAVPSLRDSWDCLEVPLKRDWQSPPPVLHSNGLSGSALSSGERRFVLPIAKGGELSLIESTLTAANSCRPRTPAGDSALR